MPKPLKAPSLARSVPKPLKVPSLARSVPKPLNILSLARSVHKPLSIFASLASQKYEYKSKTTITSCAYYDDDDLS